MTKSLIPKIIFEDAHLIVVEKPAGLLSQGEATVSSNLVDWLRQYFGRHYVGLIHRLDRNTSGIMVVAKRTKSAGRLTESLQSGELKRIYLALLQGTLKNKSRWHHWLFKNEQTNMVKTVTSEHPEAKEAVLNVTPLKSGLYKNISVTLVQFELETGRSHQIRVQAAAEGMPVLGDVKYGNEISRQLLKRPALHSWKLEFLHPMSQAKLSFETGMPADFQIILKDLK